MTPSAIIIMLFALALLGIGVLVIGQAREKARIEHKRRIQALENRYSLLGRFFTELPGDYLEQPLKRLILERALEISQQLKSLSGPGNYDKRIAADEQALKYLPSKEPPQTRSLISAEQSKANRQLLQQLLRFVEKQQRYGKLATDKANYTRKHIHYLDARSQADVLNSQAQQLTQAGHHGRAIHAYHQAISQLDKTRNHPAAAEAITRYRDAIKRLKEHDT